MSNHVHILATPLQQGAVSKLMQSLNRCYVGYFNGLYERSGTLWEGRFRSCIVDSERYLLQCYRYIELNPVRAGMTKDPAAYAWSSYRCNALGVGSAMITPHEEYLRLGRDVPTRLQAYRELFVDQLDIRFLQEIRDSTRRNLAIGSTRFKETWRRRCRDASARLHLGDPGRKM